MTDKQIKNLLIVTAVVIIVAVGVTIFNALQSNANSEKFAITESMASDSNKIQFESKETTFALQRSEDKWKVDTIKADSELVKTFIDLLKSSKVVSTASNNSGNYELFGVDDEASMKIVFFKDETKVSTLIVGKSLANGNYIRFEGDEKVYQINKNISASDLSPDEFKDKSVTSGDLGDLIRIVGGDFQLEASTNGYIFENDSTKVDQTSAQTFANAIINIKAVDIASQDESNSINGRDPNLKFEVVFKNGNNFRFELFAIGEDEILVKRDDGVVLTMYRTQFDSINYNKEKLSSP